MAWPGAAVVQKVVNPLLGRGGFLYYFSCALPSRQGACPD